MNIKSTTLKQISSKPSQNTTKAYRPDVDWWEMDSRRYDDTSTLLDALRDRDSEPVQATYRFITHAPKEKEIPSIFEAATTGALYGSLTAIGAATSTALAANVLIGAGYFLTGGLGGDPNFIGLSLKSMSLVATAGAAIGAGVGIHKRRTDPPLDDETAKSVSGTIANDGNPSFFINDDVTKKVDLSEYARAESLPKVEQPDQAESRRRNGINGALAGLKSAIPLYGYIAPAIDFEELGSAVDGARGSVLGVVAGLGASAMPWVGLHLANGSPVGYAAGTAAAATLGGVAGYSLGPQIELGRFEHPDVKKQWWSNGNRR